MLISEYVAVMIFFLTAGICAVTDLASGTIKNTVLLTGTAGILTSFFYRPPVFESDAFLLLVLFEAILILFFMLRLIGAGDVKIYAFLILAFPNHTGFETAVFSVFLAGLISVFLILKKGILAECAANIRLLIISTAVNVRAVANGQIPDASGPVLPEMTGERIRLPMAVFVLAASMMTILFNI